jgi:rhamnosyltransferase
MTDPFASILIPVRGPGEGIRSVLEAVFAQDAPFGFEVAIVDSGSSEAELALMRQFPVRLSEIPPGEFGHGRTRNLLARQAKGRALVFLTQDAEPADRRWLARLVAPLEDPRVAGAYSRQLPRPDARPMMRFFLEDTYPAQGARRGRQDAAVGALDPAPGARRSALPIRDIFFSNVGSALRREVWERIPFREDVVMSEDQYWAAEALQAGYELVYEPAAAVLHSHSYSLAAAFRRNVLSGASLRGLVADTQTRIAGGGLRYLAREMAYLARARQLRWLPYALAYELMRAAGFAWGFGFGGKTCLRHLAYSQDRRPASPAANAGGARPGTIGRS